jgi:thiamine biosynthesis lipoprotein
METQTFRAMGSRINAIWDSPAPPPQAWHNLPTTFERWEDRLSRFRPNSELSRLNASEGQTVVVSEMLLEVLEATQWAASFSEGFVVPTLLPHLEATGYTQDFKEMMATPTAITATAPPTTVYQGDIDLNRGYQRVRLPQGVRIDVGGVAKGWAADKLATHFGAISPVLIEVGGDIAVRGPRTDGSPWAIAVTNPFTLEDPTPLALVLLNEGGIATSGRDYRHWQVGDKAFHHIIDPRTGEPADTDVFTTTVIAPTTLEAEVAAKVVLIRGSEEGLAWLEQRPTLAGLVVCANGDVKISERWKQYDWAYQHP